MKDLSGLSYSFQGWSTLLDFLSKIKQPKDIKNIHVTTDGNTEWMMEINGTDKSSQRKPKPSGAALYDLYW